MKLATFFGGIDLPAPIAGTFRPFESLPSPSKIVIPLKQYVGKPCASIVKKGAEVKKGDLVGESEDPQAVLTHATVSGKITEIIKKFPDLNGGSVPAVVIEPDGKNELGDFSCDDGDPLSCIQKAGLVDFDTETVPLHAKLALAKEKSVKTLIINCVDVDPQFSSRASIVSEYAQEVAAGIDIICKIIGAENVYIGVNENASRAISSIAGAHASAQIVSLKVKHPQSLRQLLVKAILDKEVPFSGTTEDIGVSVVSVETAFFAEQAVNKKKPVLERFITVATSDSDNTKNVLVKIGTPIRDVLEHCGISEENAAKVILGSLLMGKAIYDLDSPVTKETTGIFVQNKDEIVEFPSGVCIKCGLCITVCPMRLMPFLISGFSETGSYANAEKNDIFACIECGCCAYVCPVFIPLVQWIKLGKSEIRAQKE